MNSFKELYMCFSICFRELVEALHLGTLMAAHGYFFPISDHVLTLKDDGTFYRFQVSLLKVLFKSKNMSAFSLFLQKFWDLTYFTLTWAS